MEIETLQFALVHHYLRDRKPLKLIGLSLLLFKLTDQEVKQAIYGPLTTWPARR